MGKPLHYFALRCLLVFGERLAGVWRLLVCVLQRMKLWIPHDDSSFGRKSERCHLDCWRKIFNELTAHTQTRPKCISILHIWTASWLRQWTVSFCGLQIITIHLISFILLWVESPVHSNLFILSIGRRTGEKIAVSRSPCMTTRKKAIPLRSNKRSKTKHEFVMNWLLWDIPRNESAFASISRNNNK